MWFIWWSVSTLISKPYLVCTWVAAEFWCYGHSFKGILHNQDVAIKVLRAEHLNEMVQREFDQEVYMMRFVIYIFILFSFWSLVTFPSRKIVGSFSTRMLSNSLVLVQDLQIFALLLVYNIRDTCDTKFFVY